MNNQHNLIFILSNKLTNNSHVELCVGVIGLLNRIFLVNIRGPNTLAQEFVFGNRKNVYKNKAISMMRGISPPSELIKEIIMSNSSFNFLKEFERRDNLIFCQNLL